MLGLAIAAFPTDKLPLSMLHEILEGGARKAAEAGFPIGGGHTIIDDVPKYGLAVTGVADIDSIVRNSTAQTGDRLYLTKPIGNGILVSAHRAMTRRSLLNFFRKSSAPQLDDAIQWMTRLNREAALAMRQTGVSAATDITGYGLIGHLLEMCRGSATGAELSLKAVPVLAGARELLAKGFRPDGTKRNADTFRRFVDTKSAPSEYDLMCDAQTSGGLLIAVSSDRSSALEAAFEKNGVFYARVGQMTERSGRISLVD